MTDDIIIQVNSILGFDEEWYQRFRRLSTFLEAIAEYAPDDNVRSVYYALEAQLRFAWLRYKRNGTNELFHTFHQTFLGGWRMVQSHEPSIEPPAYYRVLAGDVELGTVFAQGPDDAIRLTFVRYGGPVTAADGTALIAVKV